MADNSVIIDVSLTTENLKSQINDMITMVDKQFGELASKVDTHLSSIEKKLSNLGQGSSANATRTDKEQQSVKQLADSYDALASAQKKALDAKGTRQKALNFVASNMQNYRDTLSQVAQQLVQAEAALKQAIDNKVSQLTSRMEQDKAKIHELGIELERLKMQQQQTGNFSMFQPQMLRIQQEIENKMAHIAELQRKINEAPMSMQNSAEAQKVAMLRNEQARINSLIGEQQQKLSSVTFTLDQQFVKEQQIADILKSKATAQDAFIRATKMPTNTYDEAVAKLERLKLVQEALSKNPLLPESSILRLGRVIDETTQKVQKLESTQQQVSKTTSATQEAVNQQAQSTRQLGQSAEEIARQVKTAEEQKQQAVRQTGLVAQQTAQQIIESMRQQISSMSPSNPQAIGGLKELEKAIKEMRQTYFSMSNAEQESPIGQALKRDIEIAQQARSEIKKLNAQMLGIFTNGQNGSSYVDLKAQISSLAKEYQFMTKAERDSARGREIVDKFQQISKAAKDVEMQLRRPISLDKVLGLSANNLDNINYKLQQLAAYRGGIDITKPGTAQEIKKVNDAMDSLKKKQQEIMGGNKQLQDSNTWLARSFQYMKNRLAFYFTIGASTQFVKNLIEIRSQYEMTERALGILVDSAERGSQIFNELSTMALQSPYTLLELSQAAKQLTAYDVAAKDVVDTTRRLADMAAAVGVNIDRLTYALGQVKAYGYLNSRDARMFANAGIPLVKQLADYYTELEGRMVSVGDVYDRIKKKAVGYEDTMAVITKMTDQGGKFFDFQAKMADTLKVQLANLTLAWNNMLNAMGESNQGLITAPIKALKELFANWKSINNVIRDVANAFLILKAIQIGYVAITQKVSLALATVDVVGLRVIKVIKSLGVALKTLFLNPWTWVLVGITALVELYSQTKRETEAAEQLSAAISKSADEAAKSISKFKELNSQTIGDFKAGLLNPDETLKLWESLRDELENSADSASTLIPELISIGDIGERVQKALDYADTISEANEILKDMGNNLIKINTDVALGALGEGMVSDIKDWVSAIQKYKESFTTIDNVPAANAKYWDEETEAIKEIEKVAIQVSNTIYNLLGEEGMKDHIKVKEVLARIKQQIKLENPEIQGEIAKLFDIQLDQILSEHWGNDIFDKTASLWRDLMNEIKKTSSSEFSDISQEWIDGTEAMTDEQKKAFEDAANHLRETLPPTMRSVLDEMMGDINSRQFRINVGIAFNVQQLDDIQKDFNKHFLGSEGGNPKRVAPAGLTNEAKREWERNIESVDQKYQRLNKKTGESTLAWQKRLTDEYKAQNDNLKVQQGRLKSVSETVRADAQNQINSSKELISIIKSVGDWEGFDVTGAKDKKGGKKSTKSRVKEEDLVAKALKEEISVINEMQSAYDKLRKAGVGSTEALAMASSGYDKTLKSINATLSKYGISAFKAEDFVGSNDPHKLLNALTNQLNTLLASGKVKTSSLKDLEAEIQKITISAKEYDMKKITDGLNNELGKIKEEYELAVELDANPELGNMFADIIGIDVDSLPRTFGEAFERANNVAKQKLKELGKDISNFDLMSTDLNKFAENQGVDISSEPIKELIQWQKTFRDMFEKNLIETEKNLDEYVKKYGDYSDKVAEIEANRLDKIKRLNDAYHKEEMRETAEYQTKLNAINKGAEREKGTAMFDEFKNSRLYIAMFENLQYVSTATLKKIREKLVDLRDEMGNLQPEQLKQIVQQFEKIDNELVKRSPFSSLIKNAKNYRIAIGKAGKDAEKQFLIAQENYDEQLKVVASLKEQLELKKAQNPQDIKGITFLNLQVVLEDAKLKKLKEELEAAQALNDKYNMMKQVFKEQWQEIGKIAQVVGSNLKSLGELRDTLEKTFGIDLGNNINGVVDGLMQVGDSMNQIVSSATSGNVFGVITGTVNFFSGIGDAIASIFGDGAARTKRLNKEIKESQEEVRKLNMAYKDLERTVTKAMGSQEIAAQRALIANKKAELAEIERQMRLEKAKRSKDRDEDAIKQYEETAQGLRHEIEDLGDAIVDNLLGTNVKSAAEDFVDTWVSAWRQGETTLDAIKEKMDEVIQNLIKKAIASKVVGTLLQPFYDAVDNFASETSEGGVELTLNELRKLSEMASTLGININDALTALFANFENLGIVSKGGTNAELSALQQGITNISETTAEALEAYMNSVSQQVYYQSDILTQIRDILVNFGGDVTIATNAQILFELQQSYQVQMSIQSILQGWSNASGLAVRVELSN